MQLLAIVPARGGSKRLPGKNTKSFLGKPLVQHTLDAVTKVAYRVILTSDDPEVLKLAKEYDNVIQHARPDDLASDTSTVLETVVKLICEDGHTCHCHAVGLFLPTAPLRTEKDVIAAWNMLQGNKEADGIISTTDYEFPPTLGLVLDSDGYLHCSDKSLPFITGNTRSQDHSGVIRPNGAIYIKWLSSFKRDMNFFKGRVINYHMPRERSADIDTALDLRIAEILANG